VTSLIDLRPAATGGTGVDLRRGQVDGEVPVLRQIGAVAAVLFGFDLRSHPPWTISSQFKLEITDQTPLPIAYRPFGVAPIIVDCLETRHDSVA